MSKLTEKDKAEIIEHYLHSFDGYKATAAKFGVNKAANRNLYLTTKNIPKVHLLQSRWILPN